MFHNPIGAFAERRIINIAEMYDKIIIGAGLYGLYSAELCGKNRQNVLVVECDTTPFRRATYINQARVDQGYHYPRSLSTAMKSAGYFRRFNEEYSFCINGGFEKIYATSKEYSWSSADQFKQFCEAANIPCTELYPDRFFDKGMCDGAFLTREYTYDAAILREYFVDKIDQMSMVEIKYGVDIESIERQDANYEVRLSNGEVYVTRFLLNATYASTNQVTKMMGFEPFRIKYELCEIIICKVNDELSRYGFTVMDGPFFPLCPLGKLVIIH